MKKLTKGLLFVVGVSVLGFGAFNLIDAVEKEILVMAQEEGSDEVATNVQRRLNEMGKEELIVDKDETKTPDAVKSDAVGDVVYEDTINMDVYVIEQNQCDGKDFYVISDLDYSQGDIPTYSDNLIGVVEADGTITGSGVYNMTLKNNGGEYGAKNMSGFTVRVPGYVLIDSTQLYVDDTYTVPAIGYSQSDVFKFYASDLIDIYCGDTYTDYIFNSDYGYVGVRIPDSYEGYVPDVYDETETSYVVLTGEYIDTWLDGSIQAIEGVFIAAE